MIKRYGILEWLSMTKERINCSANVEDVISWRE